MRSRLLIAVVGFLTGLFGLFLLLDLGGDNLVATAVWAAGGVVVHDAFLAPAVLLAWLAAARVLPSSAKAPAAVTLIVLGTVTVVAIPVLGRFGARPDNPSLLDRDYVGAWFAVATLALLAMVLTSVWASRRPADDEER